VHVFGDSTYHVESHDWPVRLHRDDLTVDKIHGVLEAFDEYYTDAIRGLKAVSVPGNRPARPAGAPADRDGT
jgi:hypothetical protein